MHAVLRVVTGFFRLGPIPLGLIAAVLFGGGIWLQMQENRTNLAKAEALRAGPPPAVGLSNFNPVHDLHAFDEVAIRAQLDLTRDAELTIERRGTDDLAVMVPLLAVAATLGEDGVSAPEVLGVALFTADDFGFDQLTRADLRGMANEFGVYGPILTLNGRLGDPGDFADLIGQSFAESGAVLAPGALYVYPFLEGRVAAFGPDWPFETSIFGVFAWVAGAFGVLALLKFAFRSKLRSDWTDEELFGAAEQEPDYAAADLADDDLAYPDSATDDLAYADPVADAEGGDPAPRPRSALKTLKLIVAGFVVLWGAGVIAMLWQTGQFATLAEAVPGQIQGLQTLPADQQVPSDAGLLAQARAFLDRALAGDQFALMILVVTVLLPLGIYSRLRKLFAERRAA